MRLPSNPYKSPKTVSDTNNESRTTQSVRRAAAFLACLTLGIVVSQMVAFLFARNEWPDTFIFLGTFGVILGVLGGFLANMLRVGRIPWYYIVVGFGLLLLMLLSAQSPNHAGAARLIAVIAFIQMFASLVIGYLAR